MSEWQCYQINDEVDQALAEHIAARLQDDIASYGQASLAVSGGGTPKNMFRLLSHTELDWARVWVTLVDERWVGAEHADSNERLVRENLLQHAAAGAHFVSLKSQHDDAEQGLAEVAARLGELQFPLSMVVLGMGGDGHTASWFPQAVNLQQLLQHSNKALLGASDPVTAPHQRITLTLSAVLNSRDIAIHITGEEKRAVLERANAQGYPIAAILQQQQNPATIWWAPDPAG
jgi:6-phosphogluconolactonase